MYQTKNSLPEKVRIQIIGLLQERLADSVNVFTQAKQAHWNVKGPDFIALHGLFDKIAEDAKEYGDLIAERVVQLGGIAEGTLSQVAGRTILPHYPVLVSTGKGHLDALTHALASYGELTRETIAKANEIIDPATADIFTEILRSVDKNLWFVEAHTQSDR